MQYVIETKRLCKTYGGRTVVHNLDLHVPQGCVYGFIGPNGAGKSTSMKMLLGLVHPTHAFQVGYNFKVFLRSKVQVAGWPADPG